MNNSYLPNRSEIIVLSADNSVNEPFDHNEVIITSHGDIENIDRPLKLGWTVKEEIGIGVFNPKALKKN